MEHIKKELINIILLSNNSGGCKASLKITHGLYIPKILINTGTHIQF